MADKDDHRQQNDIASEVLEHLKNPPIEVINPNKNSGSNTKKYLIIALVLIIILAVTGFVVWKFLLNDNNQAANQQSESVAESQNNAQNEDPLEGLTQEYTSDRLLIDFKYPDGWKVDEDSGEITISAPETEVTDVGGENIPAEFKIYIKQGADQSDSEYLGRGFAVKKSTPLKYSDPGASQRKKTFITDFGLDSSDNFAYFIIQGNFELEKDATLGPDFAEEADAILVSGGFYSKNSDDKTKLVFIDPETYQADKTYLLALEIIKTLKLR